MPAASPRRRGGRRARGGQLDRSPPDAALARHLVRFDAALLVPRSHDAQHVDPRHVDRAPLRHGPVLRLGGRRLLRGHVHARLALRPRRGQTVPRTGTRSAEADRLRHGAGHADGHDQSSRRRMRAGGRRPGGLHPPRLSRAPDVRATAPCWRNSGRGSSWRCNASSTWIAARA